MSPTLSHFRNGGVAVASRRAYSCGRRYVVAAKQRHRRQKHDESDRSVRISCDVVAAAAAAQCACVTSRRRSHRLTDWLTDGRTTSALGSISVHLRYAHHFTRWTAATRLAAPSHSTTSYNIKVRSVSLSSSSSGPDLLITGPLFTKNVGAPNIWIPPPLTAFTRHAQ